jgi:hypothetical protein
MAQQRGHARPCDLAISSFASSGGCSWQQSSCCLSSPDKIAASGWFGTAKSGLGCHGSLSLLPLRFRFQRAKDFFFAMSAVGCRTGNAR